MLTKDQWDIWNKRILQVQGISNYYFPNTPGSLIINPAQDRCNIPWGLSQRWHYNPYDLFDFVLSEYSAHCAAVNEVAQRHLLGLDFRIVPYNDSPDAKAIAEWAEKWLREGIASRGTTFNEVQSGLWRAISHGNQPLGWVWDWFEGVWAPVWIKALPNEAFGFVVSEDKGAEYRYFKGGTWSAAASEKIEIDELWLVRYEASDPKFPYGKGLMDKIYTSAFELDWLEGQSMEFAERYGKPITFTQGDLSDKNMLTKFVEEIGSGAIFVKLLSNNPNIKQLPMDERIKMLSPAHTVADAYSVLLRYKQELISRVFLGSTLTVQTGAPDEERGSSLEHARTADDVLRGRARWLDDQWNYALRRIGYRNPRWKGLIPRYETICEVEQDDSEKWVRNRVALAGAGYKQMMSPRDFNNLTNATPLEDGEIGIDPFAGTPVVTPDPMLTNPQIQQPAPAMSASFASYAGGARQAVIRSEKLDRAAEQLWLRGQDDALKTLANHLTKIVKSDDPQMALQNFMHEMKVCEMKAEDHPAVKPLLKSIRAAMVYGTLSGLKDCVEDIERGQKFAVDTISTIDEVADNPSKAMEMYRDRMGFYFTPQEWAALEGAIKQKSIGFAYAGTEEISRRLLAEMEKAMAGMSKHDFVKNIMTWLQTSGIKGAPPQLTSSYLRTIYDTVMPRAYSDAQDALVTSPGGAEVTWGYQWWVTPGYEEIGVNHKWHTRAAMHAFAAPLDHEAWSVFGWYQGGAYNCKCYRQLISFDTAIERGWAMMEFMGKDASGNDMFKPVTLKREPTKQFSNEWWNQFAAMEKGLE